MIRLVADDHMSHKFIAACQRLQSNFPLIHLSEWQTGVYRTAEDPVILLALQKEKLIIVSFDRRTMAMHAAELTRNGNSHSGVILFRSAVSQMDYGKQARLLVDLWHEAANWDWSDRIEYLPR